MLGSWCDNKEQDGKVHFSKRDAVTSLDIPRAPAKKNTRFLEYFSFLVNLNS
jgi:hypothetical protein